MSEARYGETQPIFMLRSNAPPATLSLTRDDDEGFTIVLHDEGLEASTHGWFNREADEPNSLIAFFEELATEWRGWEGEKTWRALEVPWGLSATHDGLGHVHITVTLSRGWYGTPWEASAVLAFDIGSMEDLTRDLRSTLLGP